MHEKQMMFVNIQVNISTKSKMIYKDVTLCKTK